MRQRSPKMANIKVGDPCIEWQVIQDFILYFRLHLVRCHLDRSLLRLQSCLDDAHFGPESYSSQGVMYSRNREELSP